MQDHALELGTSGGQDLAQVAGNYLFDGSVDLGAIGTVPFIGTSPKGDAGFGERLEVLVIVTTAFASAGSTATVQLQIVSADNGALSSNLVVHNQTAAIVIPAAGYEFQLGRVPPGVTKRYIGVRAVIAVQTTTAGKCVAYFTSKDGRQTSP